LDGALTRWAINRLAEHFLGRFERLLAMWAVEFEIAHFLSPVERHPSPDAGRRATRGFQRYECRGLFCSVIQFEFFLDFVPVAKNGQRYSLPFVLADYLKTMANIKYIHPIDLTNDVPFENVILKCGSSFDDNEHGNSFVGLYLPTLFVGQVSKLRSEGERF